MNTFISFGALLFAATAALHVAQYPQHALGIAASSSHELGCAPSEPDWPADDTIVVRSRHVCAEFAPGTPQEYVRSTLVQLEAMSGSAKGSGIEPYTMDTRWPGLQGDPIHLRWSFVADGTVEPSCPGPLPACPNTSTMFQSFDAQFGNRAAWVSVFEQAFARWDALTGITFERIVVANDADDGNSIVPSTPNGDGPADGAPALRGDIRIRAITLDGPVTFDSFGNIIGGFLLSYGNFPDDIYRGDITFDRAENWVTTPWTSPPGAGFPRAAAHEIGHAIGLGHVCPFIPTSGNTKLMEWAPASQIGYYGPQHDDLRGAQRHYGDPNENNDSRDTATMIDLTFQPTVHNLHIGQVPQSPNGTFGPAGTQNGMLSIDGQNDVDWYAFWRNEPSTVSIRLARVGLSYQNCPPNGFDTCDACFTTINSSLVVDLKLQVFDRTGRVLIGEGTTAGGSTVVNFLATVYQPYFLKIFPVGPNATTFTTTQCYDLEIVQAVSSATFFCPEDFSCNDADLTNGVESCEHPFWTNGVCYVDYEADCNRNYIEDSWDIEFGESQDCDDDDIPDECQIDCNNNGRGDACDIVLGFSDDLDGNAVPDECQADCNENGIVDSFDISSGSSLDGNINKVPDECETVRRVPQDFPTINSAVQNANDGDTILIAAGTFTGTQNKNVWVVDKTLQIVGETGPFGTVIDMQNSGRAFVIESTTGDPQSNRTRVQRLTISNGNAAFAPLFPDLAGAILVRKAATLIERNVFINNRAALGGAVGYHTPSPNELRSCMFRLNQATSGGGAVGFLDGGQALVSNCTFASNSAPAGGAVFSVGSPSYAVIRNSIIRFNTPANSQLLASPGLTEFLVEFSDLPLEQQAQYGSGVGNIFVDPLFINLATGNLHIANNSPCKNAGYAGYPAGTKDIDDEPRVWLGAVDIGADEIKNKITQGNPP